jgi:hypothetical protein
MIPPQSGAPEEGVSSSTSKMSSLLKAQSRTPGRYQVVLRPETDCTKYPLIRVLRQIRGFH